MSDIWASRRCAPSGRGAEPTSRWSRRVHQLTLVQAFALLGFVSQPAEELDAALRALADGNRRRILARVRERPCAVGEIAEQVAMSQQAVSHHLRVLR
ncbi:MAG: metalloregulator ArsR/SmtB family transcription factor, partial [bacterium]|nr:metalloregulator ArsR/SmtB family transcription factor [bacterium]